MLRASRIRYTWPTIVLWCEPIAFFQASGYCLSRTKANMSWLGKSLRRYQAVELVSRSIDCGVYEEEEIRVFAFG